MIKTNSSIKNLDLFLSNPDLKSLWQPKTGDRYIFWNVVKKQNEIGVVESVDFDGFIDELVRDTKVVWYPYIEDYQRLLLTPTRTLFGKFSNFISTLFGMENETLSLNEYWLRYFMKEFFKKTWDSRKKKWVDIR